MQARAAPDIFKGVKEGAKGSIYYPDTIFSVSVDTIDGDGQKLFDQWSRTYRFILVPFSIGVMPAEDLIPEGVDVILAFADRCQSGNQPTFMDTFPPTGFDPSHFQASEA